MMVEKIFETIGQVITGFMGNLSTAINSVTSLIYTPGESGAAGQLTTFGVILLIASGVGVCYWLFNMVRRLIHAA